MRTAALILTIFQQIIWTRTDDLPSFIHVCHRDDPDLERCLITAVEDLRSSLTTGVPEYQIPSLEPLCLKDSISEDVQGLKLEGYNISAYGCSNYFVRNIQADMDTNKYTIDIDLPKLRIESDYRVDGKLLLLPIKGNGYLEINITDCKAKSNLQGELYDKNGEQYLRFTNCDLRVTVGGGTVRVEKLFNDDKVMLGLISDVVNKNINAFIDELMPAIERALAAEFMEIANKIVEPFSYKQLFPH